MNEDAQQSNERATAVACLQSLRNRVSHACRGVSDEGAFHPLLKNAPELTLAGLVADQTAMEFTWFEWVMEGRTEVDSRTPAGSSRTLSEVLSAYERQCSVSDKVIERHDFSDLCSAAGAPPQGLVSLRWIVNHRIAGTGESLGLLQFARWLLGKP